MVSVQYTDAFLRDARRLPADAQDLLIRQTDRFRRDPGDIRLHVKRLHGRFAGLWSFRVTRNYRVFYRDTDRRSFVLLTVDDRKDVYR